MQNSSIFQTAPKLLVYRVLFRISYILFVSELILQKYGLFPDAKMFKDSF